MSELPFDQLVRFAGTRRALERVLDAQSDARVLDVGGFPCTFARHVAQCGNRWRVETADMQEGALENYRRIAPGPMAGLFGSGLLLLVGMLGCIAAGVPGVIGLIVGGAVGGVPRLFLSPSAGPS